MSSPLYDLKDHTMQTILNDIESAGSEDLIDELDGLVAEKQEKIDELEVRNENQRARLEWHQRIARDRERTISILHSQLSNERRRNLELSRLVDLHERRRNGH